MSTEKQEQARQRNWEILQIRGAWAVVDNLNTCPRLKQEALDALDNLLVSYEADITAIHKSKVLHEHN